MTQKEIELLLKDLCARLPYGVKVQYENKIVDVDYISGLYEEVKLDILDNYTINISEVIPFLRPMSSMTEEEKNNLRAYCRTQEGIIYDIGVSGAINSPAIIDWLNAHHFDYRGLIPMGLAIAVTEENNPYKE